MTGCKTCPAHAKCDVTYRGSACAALRASYGLDDDPEIITNGDRIRAMSDEELASELLFFRPCDKAFGTDMDRNYIGLDGKYYKIGADAVDANVEWLKAQYSPEDALTLNDLRKMNGEPVWCIDGQGNECWCLVSVSRDGEVSCIDSETGEWEWQDYNLVGDWHHGLDINGWIAYRRKIQEDN